MKETLGSKLRKMTTRKRDCTLATLWSWGIDCTLHCGGRDITTGLFFLFFGRLEIKVKIHGQFESWVATNFR